MELKDVLIYGIAVSAAAYIIIDKLKGYFKQRKVEEDARRQALHSAEEAVLKLYQAVEKISALPAYVNGLVRVCGDQVVAIQTLQASVDKFSKTVLAPGDPSNFTGYDEGKADLEFRKMEYMAHGDNAESAELKAQADIDAQILPNEAARTPGY